MKLFKHIYDWVIELSNKPKSNYSISILSFSEAFFFPIPPDVLLIPLCLGNRNKSWNFALLCSVFSISGGVLGYYIGKMLWWNVPGIEYSYLATLFMDYIPGVNEEGFNNIKKLSIPTLPYELQDGRQVLIISKNFSQHASENSLINP